jgi:hypothetical protein
MLRGKRTLPGLAMEFVYILVVCFTSLAAVGFILQ